MGKSVRLLAIFALGYALGILTALTSAWCASKVYGWYLAESLGPGPTTAGWYGVAVLVALVTMGPLHKLHLSKGEGEGSALVQGFATTIGLLLSALIITGLSYVTGLICGWV